MATLTRTGAPTDLTKELDARLAAMEKSGRGGLPGKGLRLAWCFGWAHIEGAPRLGLDILRQDPCAAPDPEDILVLPRDFKLLDETGLDDLWHLRSTFEKLAEPGRAGRCSWFPLPTLAEEWWNDLLRNERIWWDAEPALQLRAGGTARLEPAWEPVARGGYRATWKHRRGTVDLLPVGTGWYLDSHRGQTGRASHALKPKAVAEWSRWVGTTCPGSARPNPEEFRRWHLPEPPGETPNAELETPARWLIFSCAPDTGGACIRVAFEYSFGLAAPGEPTRTTQRNLAFEQTSLRRLREAGLRPSMDPSSLFVAGPTPNDWRTFLELAMPALTREGWQTRMDRDFPFKPADRAEWYLEIEPANCGDCFELGVCVEGGQRINLVPVLLELLRHHGDPGKLAKAPLILPGGFMLPVPEARLRRILGMVHHILTHSGEGRDGRLPYLPLLHGGEQEWAEAMDGEVRRPTRKPMEDLQVRLHHALTGFGAELRGYQKDAVGWMHRLALEGWGGILADEMGLGKTVQVLAWLHATRQLENWKRPALVVAPTSVAPNWERETARFCPGWRVIRLNGAGRRRWLDHLHTADLVITSYDLLRRDGEPMESYRFEAVILDEAQYIKNPGTESAEAVRRLRAERRFALTGTPVENRTEEIWSIFQFLKPGCLGGREAFARLYGEGADRDAIAELRGRLGPYIMRRTKAEVLTELPPKTEVLRSIALSEPQSDLYESLRLSAHRKVRRELKNLGLQAARITFLNALTMLRQVCCHPALLPEENLRRGIPSSKFDFAMEMLGRLRAEGRRTLVFSQFTSMLDLMARRLDDEGVPYLMLTGGTAHRGALVEQFQTGSAPFFLISLRAGGSGITLTAADTVVHYEPWWNPAVEAQASDRAHRMGQRRPVTIYRLVAAGTIEEKILEMQEAKRRLFQNLFEPSEKPEDFGEMTDWLLGKQQGN